MNTKRTDAAPGSRVRRILVVDDHEWTVRLLKTLLASAGVEVAAAGTAQQAVGLAASFRPHLILMDLELPDMDGLTLARHLKAGADTRDIRIVVLTAHRAEEVEAAVREAGCDGLLTKPVEPAAFRDTVARYLEDGDAHPRG